MFELIVSVLLLILLVGVILYTLERLGLRKRSAPRLGASMGLRRAVMSIAEGLAIILVIALTIVGAVIGAAYSHMFAFLSGSRGAEGILTTGIFVGGGLGFMVSTIWTAFLFTLSAIERNTRYTAVMFEKMANRAQE